MWEPYKKGFKAYLQLERSLSGNSIEAYLSDIEKLTTYLQAQGDLKNPSEVNLPDLQKFVQWVAELGMSATSQARIISGIRTFYKYCLLEDISPVDPTALLEAP
ncbi:MAG: site-specific integrase, partial [Flavisolibacter sp.]|nr:site-specific integrase [Flavisolibacter sp.]